MKSSFIGKERGDNFAEPYFQGKRIAPRAVDWIGPAGAINSNLHDMTQWLLFHTSGGQPSGIVSPGKLAAMYEAHAEIPDAFPFMFQGLGWFGQKLNYGLGWFLGTVLGKKAVFHSGNIDGYSSLVVAIPEDEIGAVVLTNQSVSPFPGKVAQMALSILYEKEIEDSFVVPNGPQVSIRRQMELDIEKRALLGVFSNDVYGTISLLESDGKLILSYFGHKWELSYFGDRSFSFTIELFGGLKVPLSMTFFEIGPKPQLLIPFAADPELIPIVFSKE